MITLKSFKVAAQTVEYRQVKTAQNTQRSKASNVVLQTSSRAASEVRSFRGLHIFNLVTATVVSVTMRNIRLGRCTRPAWKYCRKHRFKKQAVFFQF